MKKFLTDSQKETLVGLAANKGVAVEEWQKFKTTFFIPDSSQRDSDLLPVENSPYFFALARSEDGIWTCTLAPVGEELHGCVQVNSWKDCQIRFQRWLDDVLRDQKVEDLWSGQSEACAPYWSRAQRLFVAKCLQNRGVLLDFTWHQPGGGKDMPLRVRHRNHEYQLQIHQDYGLSGLYWGKYSPAEDSFEDILKPVSWPSVKDAIRTWVEALGRELKIPRPHDPSGSAATPRASYVDRISIREFVSFEATAAHFQHPGRVAPDPPPGFLPNLHLIVGSNGSGKTGLLKAIALALLGSVLPNRGQHLYHLVRSDILSPPVMAELAAETLSAARAEAEHREQWMTVLERKGQETVIDGHRTGLGDPASPAKLRIPESLHLDSSPDFFLCAYGAGRRSEDTSLYDPAAREQRMGSRFQRVASLLTDSFTLVSFSAWLRSAASPVDPHYDDAVSILEQLLTDSDLFNSRGIIDGEACFRLPDGITVPYPALSDGYRAFLSWIGDLLHHMMRVTPAEVSLRELPGVVLVDEVDLHLHPRWQRVILRSLSETFPRLQFIVTSHSPILAGCVPRENTLVVERQEGGPSQIVLPDRSLYARDIDEILRSSLFNLGSPLPHEAESKRLEETKRQTELAEAFLRSGDQEAARAFLETFNSCEPH